MQGTAAQFYTRPMSFSQDDIEPPLTDETTEAYDRFVPHQFLELMGRASIVDVQLGDHVEKELTLLFSDIRDFTSLSESILPAENFRFINSYLSVMEPEVSRHHGIIDKFIGDGIMALFPRSADDGVRSGIDMQRRLVEYNRGRALAGYVPVRIGIGINTGLVMLGTVGGHNRMDSTVIGDAVNLAAKLEDMTKLYGCPLIISEHTMHELADPATYCIRFLDRLPVKGRAQFQSIYEVYDADPEPLWRAKQETRRIFDEAIAYFHMGELERARPLLDQCLDIAPDDKVARLYRERCITAFAGGDYVPSAAHDDGRWRDEYSIRIAEIDDQHRQTFRRFSELLGHIGVDPEALASAVETLQRCLRDNFSTEENLMRRYDYPFAEEHSSQHRHVLATLVELSASLLSVDRPTAYLRFQALRLLVDWQINHTAKCDYHLGHFLLRAGMH